MAVTAESQALFVSALKELTEKTAAKQPYVVIIKSGFIRDDVLNLVVQEASKTIDKYLVNANYNMIDLNEVNISPCVGCFVLGSAMCVHPCIINEQGNAYFNQEDMMVKVYEDIKLADLIVVVSSSYCGRLHNKLNAMIERCESIVNAQRLYGEKIIKNKVACGFVIANDSLAENAATELINWFRKMSVDVASPGVLSFSGASTIAIDDIVKKFKSDTDFKKQLRELAKRTVELLINIKRPF